LLLSTVSLATVGAAGALVSTVTASAADATLVWPDELVAVAVSVCFASLRTWVM